MSDTSNQIIQTLEAIHSDIKSAKEALKSNNVALDSNATSTLSTEINKIPTAIKESNTLIGFNNGTMSMSGGFLYKTSETDLTEENSVLMQTENGLYTIPEGKSFKMPFLNKIPRATTTPENGYSLKFKDEYGIGCAEILEQLYKEYTTYNIISGAQIGDDVKLKNLYLTSVENKYTEETDTHNFSRFFMPGIGTKVFYNNKEVTKVKCNNFRLSFNYNITEVECGSLDLDLDTIPYLADLFPSQRENGSRYGNDSAKYMERLQKDEPYLKIIMKDINFNYSFLTMPMYKADAISLYQRKGNSSYLEGNYKRSKIGIYVDDTKEENLSKLNNVFTLLNVLRFFTVYNLDGTKCYSAKYKKFISKEEFMNENYNIDYYNGLDFSPYVSYDELLMYNSGIFYPYKTDSTNPAKPIFERVEFDRDKYSFNTEISKYQITDSGLVCISGNDLGNALILNPNAEKYEIALFNYYSDIISTAIYNLRKENHTFKFSVDGNIIKDIANNATKTMPFITSCLLNGVNGQYDSIYAGFKHTLDTNKLVFIDANINGSSDGNKLSENSQSTGVGLLLASPYDTKFVGSLAYSNIETDFAVVAELEECPLLYNKYIKQVKFTENSKAYITTQWFDKPYLVAKYRDNDSGNIIKPDIPSEPMKFIFTNTTKLHGLERILRPKITSQAVLGPYTTDESAKYWDKFINILVPEDYPDLGTYAFNKYRLPVYNLDKTKKYNYSKKAWEPITALTDDSIQTNNLFTDEERVDDLGITNVQTLSIQNEYLH